MCIRMCKFGYHTDEMSLLKFFASEQKPEFVLCVNISASLAPFNGHDTVSSMLEDFHLKVTRVKLILYLNAAKVSKNVAAACVGAKNLHTTHPWLQKTGQCVGKVVGKII